MKTVGGLSMTQVGQECQSDSDMTYTELIEQFQNESRKRMSGYRDGSSKRTESNDLNLMNFIV